MSTSFASLATNGLLLLAPARVINELDQVLSYEKFDSQLHVDLKPKLEEADQEPTRRQATPVPKGVGIGKEAQFWHD